MAAKPRLNAEPREDRGTAAARRLRHKGWVPAVLYGAKRPTTHLQVSARELRALLAHRTSIHVLVELVLPGEDRRLAVVQELQAHPSRDELLHLDLHEVLLTESLRTTVPIEGRGVPFGVREQGGILEHTLFALEIECLAQDLPELLRVDVSELRLGQALLVKDLPPLPAVRVLTDPEVSVFAVSAQRVHAEAEEAAAAAEAAAAPAVVGEPSGEEAEEQPTAAGRPAGRG